MAEKKSGLDLALAAKRIKDVGQIFKEVMVGFEKDIIPHHYVALGAMFVAVVYWRSDFYLIRLFPVAAKSAALGLLFSGYFVWAIFRVVELKKFLKNLTEIFQDCDVKTATGKLPSFISDRAIDNSCRVMTLNKNRVTLKQFEAAKDKLEASLFGYIDQFTEDRTSGVMKIYYAEEDFPKVIDLGSPHGYGNFSFTIGVSRMSKKIVNLVDVPHLLVAGSSNSGKSNFIKQVITTLYLNNPGIEINLIDLKFGLEAIQFKNLPNIEINRDPQSALQALIALQTELKERGEKLNAHDCKDILAFNKLAANPEKKENSLRVLNRKIIVIDESAQLFLAGPEMTASDVAQARGIVSTLAAQGRAVGINMIISTQRPDVNVIDGSIKANLQGRVCFHMADNAASMTILDCTRAADLPNIPGRAIFRNGPEIMEVQVPQITDESLEEIFKNKRVVKESANASGAQDVKASVAKPADGDRG